VSSYVPPAKTSVWPFPSPFGTPSGLMIYAVTSAVSPSIL
jgi:hypothetical protein